MIIHKLIAQHLRHRDDADFYRLQARDAIQWLERHGVQLTPATTALDLGCGHGIFGSELAQHGCHVTFADEANCLCPELASAPFRRINIDREDVSQLGRFDLVICSNVLEHLSKPRDFIADAGKLLHANGHLYLSWTNWLSPWGGHEFSPFHYLGSRRGHRLYDKLTGRKRIHTPYQDLFPTYIGRTLKCIRQQPGLRVLQVAPRYYPEFAWLMKIPGLREFLAWNCAVLIRRQRDVVTRPSLHALAPGL
ncbi:MAG: class I SAM-dependent methyltransferase [Limisphaerales bacterium]